MKCCIPGILRLTVATQADTLPDVNAGAYCQCPTSGLLWAALVCATGLWAIAGFTTLEPMKRPAGEAWVVTGSEKMRNRPILVRAHVPSQTASQIAQRRPG